MNYCTVHLVEGGGLIKFRIACYMDDILRYQGTVRQDQVGLVARRWTYMHRAPFTKTHDVGGTVGEDVETY